MLKVSLDRMKTTHSTMLHFVACWLALVSVAATADFSAVTPKCLRIEDYNEVLNLTESEGVWNLVASTTRNQGDHLRDGEVNYAWLDFAFRGDQANFTHVIGFDGIIKSETREGLFVSQENGITSITNKNRHYNWTLYRMSNNSRLMTERIKYYKEGDVPIQLYGADFQDLSSGSWLGPPFTLLGCQARSIHLPEAHLEQFKHFADCMKYQHINVRPNLIDYASTCPQNTLTSIYLLNLTQIAGRWTLVAKATKSTNVMSPLGKNHTSCIAFTFDGNKMTYEEHSYRDGHMDKFLTDQENIYISETMIEIQKDWDLVRMRFYHTCKDCLLLSTAIMPEDASRAILHLYTLSGKVTVPDLERFKLQAKCESLTNISVDPRALGTSRSSDGDQSSSEE